MTKVMTPSKSMTSRQIDKAVSHYRSMLEKHRSEIGSSANVQLVLGQSEYLDEQLAVIRKRIDAINVLTYRGHADIVVGGKRAPKTFFQNRKGLRVYNGFRDSIATRAETLEPPATFGMNFHYISSKNGATDAQIETALGDSHLFNETHVCAVIAEMISTQGGGKEGLLLNKGFVNIFYTSSHVVLVRWLADLDEWLVLATERERRWWLQGHQVFVPSN